MRAGRGGRYRASAGTWRPLWTGLAATAAVLLGSAVATAHPDIRMTYRILFDVHDRSLDTIGESWTFDPTFSQELLGDFDADGDGDFNDAESDAVAREILPNLETVNYFTFVRRDGTDVGALTPTAFRAKAARGTVTFAIVLKLPQPVDPIAAALAVEIDDPDFTVFAEPEGTDAVVVRSDGSLACEASVHDAQAAGSADPALVASEARLTCQ